MSGAGPAAPGALSPLTLSVIITQPAFLDGWLVGFAVNILHHTDVGGQRLQELAARHGTDTLFCGPERLDDLRARKVIG